MSKQELEVEDLFNLLSAGIKKHGIKKVLRNIEVIDLQKNNVFYYEIFNFILDISVEEYNIKVEDLYKKNRRGIVTTARKIVFLLIKNHFDITDKQLASQFDRARQVVYQTRMEFVKMDKNNPEHKPFLMEYQRLNMEVLNYIKKLKGEENVLNNPEIIKEEDNG